MVSVADGVIPDGKPNGDDVETKDQLLQDVLILEKLAQRQHPYIVRYLGSRVRRGHITGIVLEALHWNLYEYAHSRPAAFAKLDKEAFLAGVESAVRFLHSLGFVHNEINPRNVMVREDEDGASWPVLIDFDSCGPFGHDMECAGSPGFSASDDPEQFVSLQRHDEYSIDRLRKWWKVCLKRTPKRKLGAVDSE